MVYSDEQIEEVMIRLGISQEDIRNARTNEQSLKSLKIRARKAYRRLALELHPDRTGNDPRKTALFQLSTSVVQEIEGMQVQSKPRRIKWMMRIRASLVL